MIDVVDVVEGSLTYVIRTYQAAVTEDDPKDAYQLVGFSEYTQALRNFDELLATCNPDELAAIDEIVRDSDSYVVYSNLSRPLERNSSLLSDPVNEGASREHGFAWVVALARLELAAILAGFTDTESPFLTVQPSLHEIGAYRQLVRDGLRTHYWALANDAELAAILRNKTDSGRLLAYHRRMKLVRKFLVGVAQLEGPHMSAEQQAEMMSWSGHMDALARQIVSNVHRKLDALSAPSLEPSLFQGTSSATFRSKPRLGR